jgi:methylated-DNA-[protein]-cysteine S-methyltransferase
VLVFNEFVVQVLFMPFVIQWVESCKGPEQLVKIHTPVAILALTFRGDVIAGTDWELGDELIQSCGHPLQQEFDGFWMNPDKMINVKLLRQGTEYRNRVWTELCNIPFGETVSYSSLAKNLGSAARAVGNACRDNPYALIVPCHRVVSVGGMGGYCGQTGGDFMMVKTKLLQFEAACKS